ncbi:hypothetical protein BDV11DRAFT_205808 [Aspergillus similis]
MPLPSTDLMGGIALIAGAASWIGKETAFAFAEAGVKGIILADLNEPDTSTANQYRSHAADTNVVVVPIILDVSNEASVAEMVRSAISTFGRIDYCVHAARAADVEMAIFDRIQATNVRGTMLVVREVSRQCLSRSLANITVRATVRTHPRPWVDRGYCSLTGLVAAPTMEPDAASKYATIGICKTAALDNIDSEIRVNTVCPGWIYTAMVQQAIKEHPVLGIAFRGMMPHKRFRTAEEVVDAT